MLSYKEAAAIAAAPAIAPVDAHLKRLLAERVHDWAATDLLDLTHLIIVQGGDTEQDLLAAAGYSPLANPLDGRRFGDPEFTPSFDWLQVHDGWTEIIETVSNDGFAFVLFVEHNERTNPELELLCRRYAGFSSCD
jgi:hypothetical protein